MEPISIQEHAIRTWDGMVASVFNAIPRLIVGVMVIVFALLVAKTVQIALRVVLRRTGFDALPQKYGLEATFKKFGIERPMSEVLPNVARWLLLFLFAQTAAEALGLRPISNAIGSFLGFLPNLVTAAGLIFLGSTAAQYLAGLVSRAARESGIDYHSALGNVAATLVIFITGVMAIAQLQISTDIIRIVTFCGLSAVGLAFGLSFGLGTREVTRNIVAGFYARKVFRAGDDVELGGSRGTLKSIMPVQTVVQVDDREHVLANAVFLEGVVKR